MFTCEDLQLDDCKMADCLPSYKAKLSVLTFSGRLLELTTIEELLPGYRTKEARLILKSAIYVFLLPIFRKARPSFFRVLNTIS